MKSKSNDHIYRSILSDRRHRHDYGTDVVKIKYEVGQRYEVTFKKRTPRGYVETKRIGIIERVYSTYALISYGDFRETLSTIPDSKSREVRLVE